MSAVLRTNTGPQFGKVPIPEAIAGHIVIKVSGCGINHGDIVWLSGLFDNLIVPVSKYGIAGGSGSGVVIDIGEGVPAHYKGKKVAFYRSLNIDSEIVGTWSDYVRLNQFHCVILSEELNPMDYCGSLVNAFTAYAFWKLTVEEGSKGILITAGNSATGRCMLGVCKVKQFPCIAIVRKFQSVQELTDLGASVVISLDDPEFDKKLDQAAKEIGTLHVFDGAGGETLSRVAPGLSWGSSVYVYGFVDESKTFNIQTWIILAKGLNIKGFSNFASKTAQDPQLLLQALEDLGTMMQLPHFKTQAGSLFKFSEIEEALKSVSNSSQKVVLVPEDSKQ